MASCARLLTKSISQNKISFTFIGRGTVNNCSKPFIQTNTSTNVILGIWNESSSSVGMDPKRWFASSSKKQMGRNGGNHIVPSPKGPHDDPLSPDEELAEKQRVENLTSFEKEMELRELDRNIALLNTYRGINTGELYTFKGKFKALARDYGMGFMAWYWFCWCSTLGITFTAIDIGGFDAMPLIANIDGMIGTNIAQSIDPRLGNMAVSLAVNEALEPVRLPFVVMTTKPVVKMFK